MLTQCPRGDHDMETLYVVIKVEKCSKCGYYTQMRAPMPIMKGADHMIAYVTERTIERGTHLPKLATTLSQCLVKVERRQAKLKNRNNGGSPKQEKDWR